MTLPSSPLKDRVLVAVNAIAGATSAREVVQRLVQLLTERGFHVEVETSLPRVSEVANAWQQEGRLKAVVGVGGDGTAAALLNSTGPGVPITLLARGTENLLAKYYRIGATPEAVANNVAEGHARSLDAGVANGRLFLLMASCGFDADVVARLHQQRQGHIRHWSYAGPIWDALRGYHYPPLTIRLTTAEGEERVIESRWFFAFNLPCYARGLPLAPGAQGSDGVLDVCTFSRGSLWHGLRYLTAVALHRHAMLADCCTARVRRVRVESIQPVPFQIDGDPGGVLPLEIEVLPGRMTLLGPAQGLFAA
jgi:diacylglycerol kinase family enzyme